jgi:uncharacterized protein
MPLSLQHKPPNLKINGKPLPAGLTPSVMEITVEKDLNLPGQFTIQLVGLTFRQRLLDIFAIGQEVSIQIAGDVQKPTLVGDITGLEPEFRSDGSASLTVWGFDRLHRLQRSQKTRSYTKLKDSQIAAQIAAEAGLIAQVEDSEVIHDYVLQANQTDLSFLQERAQLIHYEMFVEDKTLFFQPTHLNAASSPELMLGQDLLEFRPRLSSISQQTQVQVRGWNMQKKQPIVSDSNPGRDQVADKNGVDVAKQFGTAMTTLSDRPVLNSSEAEQIADAQLERTMLGLIVGEGVCRGNPNLGIGKMVQLQGLNKLFNGAYYITGVSHCLSFEVGYTTRFKARRNHYVVD